MSNISIELISVTNVLSSHDCCSGTLIRLQNETDGRALAQCTFQAPLEQARKAFKSVCMNQPSASCS